MSECSKSKRSDRVSVTFDEIRADSHSSVLMLWLGGKDLKSLRQIHQYTFLSFSSYKFILHVVSAASANRSGLSCTQTVDPTVCFTSVMPFSRTTCANIQAFLVC